MKWQFVFNSSVSSIYWEEMSICLKYVKQSGYQFFTWNGNVYNLEGKNIGITVEDLI